MAGRCLHTQQILIYQLWQRSVLGKRTNSKTDVVVTVVARIPVAIGRATVRRVVVPRTAPQSVLPVPM